jgi:hypothetical protein
MMTMTLAPQQSPNQHDDENLSNDGDNESPSNDGDNPDTDTTEQENEKNPSVAPKIDFVFDPAKVPWGHAFGEEMASSGSSSSSSTSSSSSNARPPPKLPIRVTRASKKTMDSSTEAREKESPGKDMTWPLFIESYCDSHSNQGQQEVDQTVLQPPKRDPLWNILPEKFKLPLQKMSP